MLYVLVFLLPFALIGLVILCAEYYCHVNFTKYNIYGKYVKEKYKTVEYEFNERNWLGYPQGVFISYDPIDQSHLGKWVIKFGNHCFLLGPISFFRYRMFFNSKRKLIKNYTKFEQFEEAQEDFNDKIYYN